MDTIRDLIATVNVYLRDQKSPNLILLQDTAQYITRIFTIFGVINIDKFIGFKSVKLGENAVNVRTINKRFFLFIFLRRLRSNMIFFVILDGRSSNALFEYFVRVPR